MASPVLHPVSPQNGGTHFRPSPEQAKLLQTLQTEEPFGSVRALCAAAGVSPSSLYRWQRNPAFRRWLAADLANHLFCHSAMLVSTSMNAALAGDPKMAMAMLKFSFNPNGLAAYTQYLAHPPATPEPPNEPATDAEPEPAPLPPPAGVMSATYRLLTQAKRATEASYLTAQRANLFHKEMEKLAVLAAREEADAAALESPTANCQPPAVHHPPATVKNL